MTDDRSTVNAEPVTDDQERRIRRRQTIRMGVLVVIGGILVIWALVNRDDTQVDWLVTETTSPLIVVMLAAAVLGFLFGFVVARRRSDD